MDDTLPRAPLFKERQMFCHLRDRYHAFVAMGGFMGSRIRRIRGSVLSFLQLYLKYKLILYPFHLVLRSFVTTMAQRGGTAEFGEISARS